MEITTSYSSGRLTLHLSGELDHHGARGAMKTIEGLLDKYMPRDAVLDLSEPDVHGLLRHRAHHCARSGACARRAARAAVAEPQASQPLRVLDASGIDRLIPVRGEQRV